MSGKTKEAQSGKKLGIKYELKKWKKNSKLDTFTFIDQKENILNFTLDKNELTITCPKDYPKSLNELFYINYDSEQMEWLTYVSIYIQEKRPTLSKLLKKIESEYEKNKIESEEFEYDIDDEDYFNEKTVIDEFDMELCRIKSKLRDNLSKCSSLFEVDSSKQISKLFEDNIPGLVLMKEFVDLYKKYKSNDKINISTVDDNIYHWNVKFSNFSKKKVNLQLQKLKEKYDYDYVEFDLYFHHVYYPAYPPLIKYKRPKLNNFFMHRLSNLKMNNTKYWTPSRSMEYVIDNLYKIVNENKDIDIDYKTEMNDIKKNPMGAYLELESDLMKLASYCDNIEVFDNIDTEDYHKMYDKKDLVKNKSKKGSTPWVSGTGYGTDQNVQWDVSKFIALEETKDKQLAKVLQKIIISIDSHPEEKLNEIYDIIKDSYLIPFIKKLLTGVTMLEINKRKSIYTNVFTILQYLTNENSISLFKDDSDESLYNTIETAYNDAIEVQKIQQMGSKEEDYSDADMTTTLIALYEMLKPCYDTYIEKLNIYKGNTTKKLKDKLRVDDEDDEYKQYINTMKSHQYGDHDILKSNYVYIENTKEDVRLVPKTARRIAQEYGNLSKNLPLHSNASIFFKRDTANMLVCRAMITGPIDTPYDSGCFIFDILLHSYPTHPPKVLLRNTGNKRFNPNLYNAGKVCLSLLGTWSGSNGEKWLPAKSTLFQVLNSIQSLILVDNPFFNEPSYEREIGTKRGEINNENYNQNIRLYTMNHAMSDLLEKPDQFGGFEKAIKDHFRLRKDHILEVVSKWVEKLPKNHIKTNSYKEAYDRLKKNLAKL